MIYWWLERGIDGFRVDAISHIQKQPGLPSLPNPKGEKYVSSFDYHMNVAGIEKHLHELKEQAFDPFNIVTVGEANGVTADNALLWVAEATEHDQGGVFNMIFQFEHMKLWSEEQSNVPLDLVEFKRILSRWQDALEGKGWNALYLENHDQARSIDTFADPTSRYASATALASCYFLMKGTPFIYQGQEIGMVNHQFTSLDEFNDVSARNLIQKLSQQGQSDADILALLNQVSRDHSRLPMQWNAQDFAGFSEVQPWFSVNQQYADINVEQQQNDPNSILSFYKQLIALRKSNVSLVVGRYQLLLPNDHNIYAYQRVAQDMTWTIITNLSPQESIVDIDRMQLGELMLDNQNVNNEHVRSDFIATQIAPPYAAYIFARKH